MRICLFILIVGLCHDVGKATECVARGRFPNTDEPDCRGYTMCIPSAAGFMQYKLTCPLGSVYSHIEQQCTTSTTYHCHPNYTCNVTGNFEDYEFKNCSSFVSCVTGLSGLVAARRVECTAGLIFSPGEGCVNETEYVCQSNERVETTTLRILDFTTLANENANGFLFSEKPLNGVGVVRLDLFIVMLFACFIIKSI